MEFNSQQVCEDLMAVVASIKRGLNRLADVHDLTIMQLFALYNIQEGARTMGQVAERMHCDASNATGIIDRLVIQRLVVRQESPNDRRAKLLALTDRGQVMIDEIMNTLPFELGCNRMAEGERELLHRMAKKLAIS